MKVRPLELADVAAVLEIQNLCSEIAQWSTADYDRVARGEMKGWIAKEGFDLTGFVVARRIQMDLEILNFAVHPDSRRQGIGSGLLSEALDWGKSFKAEKAFLEVRASNQSAIDFYIHFGFEITGRRPRYYTDPIEDALLLAANLPVASANQ